jgi:hypothetical protein
MLFTKTSPVSMSIVGMQLCYLRCCETVFAGTANHVGLWLVVDACSQSAVRWYDCPQQLREFVESSRMEFALQDKMSSISTFGVGIPPS